MADQFPVPSSSGRDWTVDVTNRIESVVATVRDNTTVPAAKVATAVVFGVVAATLSAVALILGVVALLRILYVYVPIHPVGRRVWVVDAAVGAIFLGAGAFFWRRRPRLV